MAKFSLSTCKVSQPDFNPVYFKLSSHPNSNRSLSACSKCYVSTDAQTRQQRKAENRSNHFYECRGYEAFLPYWNKALRLPFLSINNSGLLAVPLADVWVPDSPTTKIKKEKISETLVYFTKICTRENYQPYNMLVCMEYRLHIFTYIIESSFGRLLSDIPLWCWFFPQWTSYPSSPPPHEP